VSDLSMRCAICGDIAARVCDGHPGYVQGQTYAIYHCAACDTSFCAPREPIGSVYDMIYRYAGQLPGYRRYKDYVEAATTTPHYMDYLCGQEESYWGVREVLKGIVPGDHPTRVLDVGCGLGYFTFALKQSGYDALGIDVSPTAIATATKGFGSLYVCGDLAEFASATDERFDVVVLNQLIEHVPNPVELLKAAVSVLTSDGIAVITTPNKSLSPTDAIWETDLPPVHLWWFSERTMRHLADTLGVSVSFVDFTEYYRTHYIHWPAALGKKPVFTASGTPVQRPSRSKGAFKTVAARIGLLPTYRVLRNRLTLQRRLVGSRGRVYCAVLRRTT